MIELTLVHKYLILSNFDLLKYQRKLALAINKPARFHTILQRFQSLLRMVPDPLETLQKMVNFSRNRHPAPY